jgi:hypothetical protein
MKMRYDFYIPTCPAIAIEYDGDQHDKFNSHFFKSIDSWIEAGDRDEMKNTLSIQNDIIMIRLKDNNEAVNILFEQLDLYLDILKQGVNEDDKYYRIKQKQIDFKKQIYEQRKKFRDSNRNRHK